MQDNVMGKTSRSLQLRPLLALCAAVLMLVVAVGCGDDDSSSAAPRASKSRNWSDLDVLPITLSCTDSLLLGRHDLRLPAATHAAGTRDAVRDPLPLTPQPSVRHSRTRG